MSSSALCVGIVPLLVGRTASSNRPLALFGDRRSPAPGAALCFGDQLQLWTQSWYSRSFSYDLAQAPQRYPPGPLGCAPLLGADGAWPGPTHRALAARASTYTKLSSGETRLVVPPLFAARATEHGKFLPAVFTVVSAHADHASPVAGRLAVSYGEVRPAAPGEACGKK